MVARGDQNMDSVTSSAELVRAFREHRHAGRSCVLATLVRVVGPAFRPLGSRMLVGDDGSRIGDLSGGCLDDDVAARAVELFETGGFRRLVYDGERIADLARGFATGCPRRVEILLQGVDPDPTGVLEHVAEWDRNRRSGVVLTLFGRDESDDFMPVVYTWPWGEDPTPVPGDPGLAEEIRRVARAVEDEPVTRDVVLRVGEERIRVLAEVVRPRPRLLLIGGSVVVIEALRSMARALDWETVCVAGGGPAHGTRPEDERSIDPAELDETLDLDDRTGALVLTHHNARDAEWIRALLASDVAYVGVMGSRRRLKAMFATTGAVDDGGRLYAPVGLDLGGRSPHDVALAILSEMQAVLNGRTARPLREGLGTGDTGAIVLAAGGSRRLGTAKQLLQHGRRTLLRRTVEEVVATGCRPVVVVLGAEHERMVEELRGLDVSVCVNESWPEGMGTSLARGMSYLRELPRAVDRVLVTLCDQPAVDASLLRELLESHARGGRSMTGSAYAATIGVPAVFEGKCFGALEGLQGDRGARSLLRDDGADVTTFPFAAGALDVDRPEDASDS